MIRPLVILAVAAPLYPQSPLLKRGAEVYRTSCAVAYCHGSGGTASRAPRLAGRDFSAQELFTVVLDGKPGTAMPGFSQKLKTEDVEAVTQYVLSLSSPAASAKPAGSELPPAAQKGRALFFDAVRMGGCGSCHEVDDRGSPVGPHLKALSQAQIRSLRTPSPTRVVTASPVGEEPFPAIQLEKTPESIRVYDLTSPLPVLRTFRPAQVRITPGSAWSHATAVQSYSQADLEAISGYLAWVLRAQPPK